MAFTMIHENYNVSNLDVSISFYEKAFAAAHEKHSQMGCICFENKTMGIYFIEDPDGYWLEIVPTR